MKKYSTNSGERESQPFHEEPEKPNFYFNQHYVHLDILALYTQHDQWLWRSLQLVEV